MPGGPAGAAESRLHGDDDPAVGHAVRLRPGQLEGKRQSEGGDIGTTATLMLIKLYKI